MKRTKLKDRILPKYTKGEEIFNYVTHIVGGAVGIVTVVFASIIGAKHNSAYSVVSGVIFGTTMIFLYTMSVLYHALKPDSKAKKVFQILDHCAIFSLIAGTYTPIALCSLREHSIALGWTIFGVIWAMAALGITLNAIDLKKYKKFSMICYLAMGWCIIVTGGLMLELLTLPGFILLISGGVVYTIGAALYVIGKKHKYIHSLFHIFVLLGNILHALCVLLYVL